MGCFNTVLVECPHCKKDIEFQSKSGSCTFKTTELEVSEPEDGLSISGFPTTCDHCKQWLIIKSQISFSVEKHLEDD